MSKSADAPVAPGLNPLSHLLITPSLEPLLPKEDEHGQHLMTSYCGLARCKALNMRHHLLKTPTTTSGMETIIIPTFHMWKGRVHEIK